MSEPKKRKISGKDWDKVEKFVNDEYKSRKESSFRKKHEAKWKEVDRQIEMSPMQVLNEVGAEVKASWHSVLELGELSKASEVITSDFMRITFPDDHWFEPHVRLDSVVGPNGKPQQVDSKKQKVVDGLLRSLMRQQHNDFGLKTNVRLSVKEALHHGSFVAEVRMDNQMMVKDGTKVKNVKAPIWEPVSMWNAYPDPSPSVSGTNLFYNGSMIIVKYVPLAKFQQMAKGDGWRASEVDKVRADKHQRKDVETKDVELVYFYGDISMPRQDGDVYLPNSKVICANEKLVFWANNELPFPSIIYGGYERQDVRDPYYTSPIIKQSPMQKFCTVVTNKFIDAVSLKVEPPIEYDSNDPDYVQNDGPTIAPGAKSGTKSMGNGMKILDIGDPKFALEALQMGLNQMQEGTAVNAQRSGQTASDRQTATEVTKIAQGGEVRTVEFVSQFEQQGLKPFLYMQHALNREQMEDYEFYNDEMHTPDFVIAGKKDIQADAHFQIVGSKGLLGEEQRTQRSMQATAFFAGSPIFAPLLKAQEIMLGAYRDAGEKSPEEFVKVDAPPQGNAEQAQLQLEEAQKQIQQAGQKLEQEKKALEGVKEKLQKQGNDQALQQVKIAHEQKILAMEKDMHGFKKQVETAQTQHHEHIKGKAQEIQDSHESHQKELSKAAEKQAKTAEKAEKSEAEPAEDGIKIADLKKALADMEKKLASAVEKSQPKSITVQRGKDGKITGATVH